MANAAHLTDEQAGLHPLDFDSNAFKGIFDNCENAMVSPHQSNFLSLDERQGEPLGVGTAKINGTGTVHWHTLEDDGTTMNTQVQ